MTPRVYAFGAFALVLGAPLLFHARERARTEQPAQPPSLASPASSRGASIHRLRSQWTTDEGRAIRLGELRDAVHVLALFFTSCPRACPTLVNELKTLERRLPEGSARFLLISIDPERDSVDALRAYRKRMGLGERWTLLRGKPEDVRELAMILGFGYGADETAQLVHSKLVTVLGPSGEVLHQEPDLSLDPQRMFGAIRGARALGAAR
jgi:protein SCO1